MLSDAGRSAEPVNEPSLLMVPGLGLSAEAWEPTMRELVLGGVPAGSIAAATLPGYGEPRGIGDPVHPEGAARRLIETSLPRGRRCVLVGHSSSCQVVAHAAVLAPDQVTGLLLVGPTTDPRAATWPRLVLRWLATAVHEPPGQIPSLARQYRRTGVRHMLRVMDAARIDRIDRTLGLVRCPVVVLRGPHDRIAPADWCSSLAPTVTLSRGGHMVPLTDGDLVARELRHRYAGPGPSPWVTRSGQPR
jgi:pimeloyl-ACP methyl ester carboxylesterase